MPTTDKIALIKKLQAKINAMQGLGKPAGGLLKTGFEPFAAAFPGHAFPTSAVHEFISYEPVAAASTTGFIGALAGKFMRDGGWCLWIGSEKKTFPLGLKHFGLDADRIIFIHIRKPQDAMWILEEALKCEALAAVIGDIKELGFTESRRLQLAVEQSGVTGFIHCYRPRIENTVACTTRWRINPIAGVDHSGLPGLIYNCWDVQLIKVRNGKPGSWLINWSDNRFSELPAQRISTPLQTERQTG